MEQAHSLLKRQLKRCFGDKFRIPDEWQGFVGAVDAAYREFDADRQMLERSLELSSQELLEANSELRAVVYGSPIPQFVIDRNHRVTCWNKALEEITGVKAEQVIGTNRQWSAFYSEERPCMADLLVDGCVEMTPELYAGKYSKSRLMAGAYEATDYNPTLSKGGKWLHFTAAPIRDSKGDVTGAVEILEDITERRRAEELLQASEMKYRSFFETIPHVIYQTSREGKLLAVNPAFTKLFGYDSKDIATFNVERDFYVNPEDRKRWMADIETKGEVHDVELVYKRKNGERIIVLDNARVVRDAKGAILYYEGTLTDITERKRMEEEIKRYSEHLGELVEERTRSLAESERRYRRLFESTPISLWEEDFSEVKKHFDELRSRGIRDLRRYFTEHPEDLAKCASMVKILNVNEATLELYGTRSVEELLSELRRVVTHECKDDFREELLALAEGKTRFAGEFDNQTLTCGTKDLNVILTVIPGYEETLGRVLVSIVDLTERKRMEKRLQQAERLAAIGQLAAMVGHDLRNPIQGITGAAYLLRNDSLTREDRDETLQLIDDSLKHADEIVSELLDYSREIHLALAEVTPKEIVGNALETVRIPDTIQLEDQSQEQPLITVDSDRMRRVFINLITNAVDAMPNGGALTIRSKESNGSLEMTVSDTGTGLDKRILENLWKPLQTTKSRGIGLGLTIVKRIVDAHGGEITVQSRAGLGTTFTIRLPIKPNLTSQGTSEMARRPRT